MGTVTADEFARCFELKDGEVRRRPACRRTAQCAACISRDTPCNVRR